MATSTRSSGAGTTSGPSAVRRAVPIVGALVAAAVVVALVIAFASGDDTDGQQSNEAARIPAGSLRQVSFAETEGTPLPRFDPDEFTDPAIGSAVPTIRASYFDGTDVTIDPGDGQPRILLFVAHWCPHCQAEVKSLGEWFAANGLPADVDVVAISTSVDQGAPNYPPSEWFLREQWPVPILRDSEGSDLAAGYGLSGFPYVVVVDAEGRLMHRQTGAMGVAEWETLVALAAGPG